MHKNFGHLVEANFGAADENYVFDELLNTVSKLVEVVAFLKYAFLKAGRRGVRYRLGSVKLKKINGF